MRESYIDQLDGIVEDLVALTSDVRQAVRAATTALLDGDAVAAEHVIDQDRAVDAARQRVEASVFELLALQQPVATDLRMLVAAMRMVGELERIGDHAVHVAEVARRRAPDTAIPDQMTPTILAMAQTADQMLSTVAGVIASRDPGGARRLETDDEHMDNLRRSSFRIMLADSWPHGVEPAVDIALLGRFYERIADHTVSLARRIRYLVTGDPALS